MYILRPHVAGILYAPPPFYTPPTPRRVFQGGGGVVGMYKMWPLITYPPPLFLGRRHFSGGGGVHARCIFLKPPAAGFFSTPLFYTPPTLEGYFQGWGGYKIWPPSHKGTSRRPSRRRKILPETLGPVAPHCVLPLNQVRKNSLNIKFLGGIFLGHPGPRRRDVPDKNFMQVAFFCCFRQGVAGMSRDLGRDVPDLEKLYARKLWADFSYPT